MSIWTAVYQFWAHLIWVPKTGNPEEIFLWESKQIFRLNTFLF